jgi:predicted AlkP superfamily pyrophosphatase or phosphodiesterase
MGHGFLAVLIPESLHIAAVLVFLAIGVSLPSGARASSNDRVVLITIDGLAAFYLSDPQASLPTLRRLAAEGASAEGLRVSNPATTWPNHTTLITGVHPDKHSVLFNGVLIRGGPGQPVAIEGDRDKHDLVTAPTLYDQLHFAGYRTAAINWPCTRGAKTLDDNFPDAPDGIGKITPTLRAELIRAGKLDDGQDSSFQKKGAEGHDRIWTEAALHILRARPPKLLLLHLLATDLVQHQSGPKSPAAYSALTTADAEIAEVVKALGDSALREQTTLVVASDHGFARPLKLINPNVILRKAGLLRPGPRRRAQSVSEGGTAFVFLTLPSTAKEDRAKVIELLREVEGVSQIIEPGLYSALHLPDPATNPQTGDLLLVAKEGYAFSDKFFEDEVITLLPISLGSHGYLSTDPHMNGILIAWGNRIKPATKLGLVDNVDVAPTIAALLEQDLPGTQGRVLREMLLSKEHH